MGHPAADLSPLMLGTPPANGHTRSRGPGLSASRPGPLAAPSGQREVPSSSCGSWQGTRAHCQRRQGWGESKGNEGGRWCRAPPLCSGLCFVLVGGCMGLASGGTLWGAPAGAWPCALGGDPCPSGVTLSSGQPLGQQTYPSRLPRPQLGETSRSEGCQGGFWH